MFPQHPNSSISRGFHILKILRRTFEQRYPSSLRHLVRVWRMDAEGSYNLCQFIICGLMNLSLPSPAAQPQRPPRRRPTSVRVAAADLDPELLDSSRLEQSMDQADSRANIWGVVDIVDRHWSGECCHYLRESFYSHVPLLNPIKQTIKIPRVALETG